LFLNNIVGAIMPNILGAVIKPDTSSAFQRGIMLVLVIAIGGLVVSAMLMVLDNKRGGLLWHPENSKQVAKIKKKIN
jgi:hypothetical protein